MQSNTGVKSTLHTSPKPALAEMRNLPLFSQVAWNDEAKRFLSGNWIADHEMVFPGYAVTPYWKGGEYGTFLVIKQTDDEDCNRWLVCFNDLFADGGADGDCEGFDTQAEAIARACAYALENGFVTCPLEGGAK